MEPRKGFFAALSLQEGGGPLQGSFSYLRVLPDVRGYVSVLDDQSLTFAGRLRVGELWPTSGKPDDTAVVTRFYGGGATSMRGFSERRMSPLLLAPAPGTFPQLYEAVPIGGNGLIDGSFEARYSLTDSWRVAGFVDFGQVTTGLVKPSDVPDMLWAVGIGVRYITSIGPIRVDLARRLPFGTPPILRELDNSTGEFVPTSYPQDWTCFGLFGSRPPTTSTMPIPVTDSACTLQISIGEAY
jgi:translocation and assembly module TamA